jgi:hypothetical protein
MQLSNAISDAVLAVTSIAVFFHFCANLPLRNRLLWGMFLITIALAAATGTLRFAGMTSLIPTHTSLNTLAGSLGIVAFVVAVAMLITRREASVPLLGITLLVGLTLFFWLLYPRWQPFEAVVQSFGMLVVMLLAVWSLFMRNRKAIWLVVGIMLVGLSTKILPNHLPFNPTDAYHYALALALVCFGKAV